MDDLQRLYEHQTLVAIGIYSFLDNLLSRFPSRSPNDSDTNDTENLNLSTTPNELLSQNSTEFIDLPEGSNDQSKPKKLVSGGYSDEMFICLSANEQQEMMCSICYCVLKEPYQCHNEHRFCYNCIYTWSTGPTIGHDSCPVCRCDGLYAKNNELNDHINQKHVKCLQIGCNWIGKLLLFDSHEHKKHTPLELDQLLSDKLIFSEPDVCVELSTSHTQSVDQQTSNMNSATTSDSKALSADHNIDEHCELGSDNALPVQNSIHDNVLHNININSNTNSLCRPSLNREVNSVGSRLERQMVRTANRLLRRPTGSVNMNRENLLNRHRRLQQQQQQQQQIQTLRNQIQQNQQLRTLIRLNRTEFSDPNRVRASPTLIQTRRTASTETMHRQQSFIGSHNQFTNTIMNPSSTNGIRSHIRVNSHLNQTLESEASGQSSRLFSPNNTPNTTTTTRLLHSSRNDTDLRVSSNQSNSHSDRFVSMPSCNSETSLPPINLNTNLSNRSVRLNLETSSSNNNNHNNNESGGRSSTTSTRNCTDKHKPPLQFRRLVPRRPGRVVEQLRETREQLAAMLRLMTVELEQRRQRVLSRGFASDLVDLDIDHNSNQGSSDDELDTDPNTLSITVNTNRSGADNGSDNTRRLHTPDRASTTIRSNNNFDIDWDYRNSTAITSTNRLLSRIRLSSLAQTSSPHRSLTGSDSCVLPSQTSVMNWSSDED